MLFIFVCSAICIFFATILAAWFANKVLISMKRDNYEYELEINKIEEKGEE